MKIVYFTDTFYPRVDGVGVSISNFCKNFLKNKNNKITIICPKYNNSNDNPKIEGMTIQRIPSLPLFPYKDLRIVLPLLGRIKKIISEEKPDIIHIHSQGPLGYLGILCAKYYRIHCVGTYHTLLTEHLAHIYLNKYLFSFLEKKTRLRDKVNQMLRKIIWTINSKIYNQCDLVIVPSKSVKSFLKENGVQRKIIVISNGVDINLFSPKSVYSKNASKILYVGRVSYEKNLDLLVNEFAKALRNLNDVNHDIKLTIIGDGPALESVRSLVSSLCIKDKVNFLGTIPNNKLPRYYREHDIFVTASTLETQGLVILEAMASGLPVIAVNKYAIPDSVKDGYNGCLVNDPREIHTKIELMISNPELIKKLGKNARKSVKKHDLIKTNNKLESVYGGLIDFSK